MHQASTLPELEVRPQLDVQPRSYLLWWLAGGMLVAMGWALYMYSMYLLISEFLTVGYIGNADAPPGV